MFARGAVARASKGNCQSKDVPLGRRRTAPITRQRRKKTYVALLLTPYVRRICTYRAATVALLAPARCPTPFWGSSAGTYFFGTSDTLIVLAAVEYVARKRSLNPFWLPTADEDWFLLRDMDREQLEAKRKHNLALPVSARSTFLSEVRADHLSTGLAACS